MAYTTRFEGRGFLMAFQGRVTLADIRDASAAIWETPEWPTAEYELADLSGVSELAMNESDATAMAMIDDVAGQSSQRKLVAIVTTDTALIQVAEAYVETVRSFDWHARVFPTLTAARQWIEETLPASPAKVR